MRDYDPNADPMRPEDRPPPPDDWALLPGGRHPTMGWPDEPPPPEWAPLDTEPFPLDLEGTSTDLAPDPMRPEDAAPHPDTDSWLPCACCEPREAEPQAKGQTVPDTPRGPDGEPWGPPVPLSHTLSLPPFPVDALPLWLGEYVAAVAEATQTPVDMAGTLALSVLATGCAKKYRIEPKPGWLEHICLYTLTVMETGERKSPVFAEMIKPIRAHERERAKVEAPLVKKRALERSVLDARINELRKRAVKAKNENDRQKLMDEAHRLALDLVETPALYVTRLLVDDCTPEQLAVILDQQGGRIALLTSEGGPFDMMAGRYSKQPGMGNFEVYLHGYSGEDVRVDRVSRDSVIVHEVTITIGMTVQPAVLRELGAGPGFDDKGLLPRFLFSMPRSSMGRRNIHADPIPPRARTIYQARVIALLEVHPPERPWTLRLSPRARTIFDAFRQKCEDQRTPGGRFLENKNWTAKFEGQVARLTALLHLADLAGTGPLEGAALEIGPEVVERAIRLGHYFLEHALAAFGEMQADSTTGEALYLLDRARSVGQPSFSRRDLFEVARGRFKRVEEMKPALEVLLERDYLRAVEPTRSGKAGRPHGPTIFLNPLA